MEDDYPLIMSPLCQSITDKGHTFRIEIYRDPDSDWTLEVVDSCNYSTVWDNLFPTDQSALDEALRTIREESTQLLASSASSNLQ